MFARVARAEVHPEQAEEFIARWERGVLPAAKTAPGYQHAYGLYDPESHEVLSVILYDTRDHVEAAVAAMVRAMADMQVLEFTIGSPTIRTYEVRVEG